MQVGTDDRIIRKPAFDGFYQKELELCLRDKEIETLIVTGYAIDFCVDTSICSAASKELSVIVVSEAHKDRPVLLVAQIKAHLE